MINTDEFYKAIERRMLVDNLRSTGEMENAFFQHVGKIYNHNLPMQGGLYDEIIGNLDRMIRMQKKHGEGQNKKTDSEKLQELGRENI